MVRFPFPPFFVLLLLVPAPVSSEQVSCKDVKVDDSCTRSIVSGTGGLRVLYVRVVSVLRQKKHLLNFPLWEWYDAGGEAKAEYELSWCGEMVDTGCTCSSCKTSYEITSACSGTIDAGCGCGILEALPACSTATELTLKATMRDSGDLKFGDLGERWSDITFEVGYEFQSQAPATPAPPPAPPTTAAPTGAPPTGVPLPPNPLPPHPPPTLVPHTVAPPTPPTPPTATPPTATPPAPPTPPTPAPPALPTPAPRTGVPATAVPRTAAPRTVSPPTEAPPTQSPPTLAPTAAPPTPAPTAVPTAAPPTPEPPVLPPSGIPEMDVECPRNVTSRAVRAQQVELHATVSYGDFGTPRVVTESVEGGHSGGIVWLSEKHHFVRTSTHGDKALIDVGHGLYAGGTREVARFTIFDDTTGASGSCVIAIEPSPTAGVTHQAEATRAVPTLAVASIGAAGAATTLSLLATPNCGAEEELPFSLHPTGLVVNDNPYFGVIVGNMALAAGVALATYTLVFVVWKCFPKALPFQELLSAKGLTRFPSVALFLFLLLYQGTVYASLHLVAYPGNVGQLISGIACTIFCAAIPVITARAVRVAVPLQGVYAVQPEASSAEAFMLGPGEWVAVRQQDLWHQRYLSMIKPYRQETCWFAIFSFLLSFAVAALNVPQVDTLESCGHLKVGVGVIFILMAVFVLTVRPYARGRDNVMYVGLHGVTAAALFLQASGFYSGDIDDWHFDTASDIFGVSMIAVITKAAIDMICDIFVAVKGRRKGLQDRLWDKAASLDDFDAHAGLHPVQGALAGSGLQEMAPLHCNPCGAVSSPSEGSGLDAAVGPLLPLGSGCPPAKCFSSSRFSSSLTSNALDGSFAGVPPHSLHSAPLCLVQAPRSRGGGSFAI